MMAETMTSPVTPAAPAPPALAQLTRVRVLPPEEWPRLAALPFAERYGIPPVGSAIIVVAENDAGEIVGLWSALHTVHLEGLWIDPEYRRTTRTAAQLLRGMKEALAADHIVHSFTMVEYNNPEVLVLALKAGFVRLPVDLLFLELLPTPPTSEGER